jgi:Lipocalin-like domain
MHKLNYTGRDTMNRRSILGISAMTTLGLALLPTSSMAQQKSLKDQLVGTWVAVSAENTARNGGKQQLYGAVPNGALFLDASGRFALVIGRPGRPKFKSASRHSLDATPEELKATVTGFTASYGTWSVNESDKTLSRRSDANIIPNGEGLEQKYSVSLAGDELKTISVNSVTGDKAETVYRRAK